MTGLPTPGELGSWFLDEHARPFAALQDADGYTHTPNEFGAYAYAWVTAFVDHDMECFFLLEARVHDGRGETRHHVFLAYGSGGRAVIDRHVPISFSASTEEHRAWGLAGMRWFSDLVYAWYAMGDVRQRPHNLG